MKLRLAKFAGVLLAVLGLGLLALPLSPALGAGSGETCCCSIEGDQCGSSHHEPADSGKCPCVVACPMGTAWSMALPVADGFSQMRCPAGGPGWVHVEAASWRLEPLLPPPKGLG